MSLNQCFAVLACLAVMAPLPGCASGMPRKTAPATTGDMGLQEAVIPVQTGETRLRTGQVLAIELDGNASTGYGWEVIDAGSPQLVPAPVPASREVLPAPMPGAGGTSRWCFRAVQPGPTTLRLVYRRAWEKDVPPARTASYRIVVE